MTTYTLMLLNETISNKIVFNSVRKKHCHIILTLNSFNNKIRVNRQRRR